MLFEPLEDRVLMATASLVGANLQISFTSTGSTAEYVEIRRSGAIISLLGNISAPSFSTAAVNQVTVTDAGGGTGQYLAIVGGQDLTLSSGFSSNGVERVETFDVGTRIITSAAATISVNAPRSMVLREGTTLQTEHGGISLAVNPAGTNTSSLSGIIVRGVVETVGTGHINVSSIGSTAAQFGVWNTGIIRSTSTTNAPTQGTITIQGTGRASGSAGVMIGSPSNGVVTSQAGNITIQGQGGIGDIQDYGVSVETSSSVTAFRAASISINGVAGRGASSPGVNINGGTVRTESGNLSITGTGGTALFPAETFNPGIFSVGGTLTSTTGIIDILGFGGTSADYNVGVSLGATVVSSANAINLAGEGGTGNYNFGIAIDNHVPISSGVALTLRGDSIDCPHGYFTNPQMSAPLVTLMPRTPGTPIRLVGGDILSAPKVLGIASRELNDVVANVLRIGDASAGTITVVAANVPATNVAWNMELVTGGDIVINATLSTVDFFTPGVPTKGNLLLSPGPLGSVQPKATANDLDTQGTTGPAFTTSFAAGSDLAINIAGLTANTQYDRLTAVGAVNLTGADLRLTGGFVSSTGNVFTIVSATSVAGIFNGLPNNSNLIFNGRVLRVNYSATTATLTDIGPAPNIDLAGRVFSDVNNDGLFNGSDTGVSGVAVDLYNESNLAVPVATVLTTADGSYLFDANLSVGSYRIVAAQPAGTLDGKESVGSLGGSVNNSVDSQVIQGIVVGYSSGAGTIGGYNFAELQPSRVQGIVWSDTNNNGDVDLGEQGIENADVRLTGTDDRGASVDLLLTTDSQGSFEFLNLRPSDSAGYTLTETQPSDLLDGSDVIGTVNGVVTGTSSSDDVISQIVMTQAGSAAVNYNFAELQPSRVQGLVWLDTNNNGQVDFGEQGIEGVSVRLTGTDDRGAAVDLLLTTDSQGSFEFADLRPSDSAGYALTETQPVGNLDGTDSIGNVNGVLTGTSTTNDVIGQIVMTQGGSDAIDYNFAELRPSRVQGLVWLDTNNNGEVDFGEQAIEGVPVRLTGTDDRGAAVDILLTTNGQGLFEFLDLRPSDSAGYTLTETQPASFLDGPEIIGTVNGVLTGASAANDVISQIAITQSGSDAINYNFAERPAVTNTFHEGQAAGIGFWQNKNGQALIKSLNGGPTSTQLGNWLAATFPNMYGVSAGANNLAGKTNAAVASFYQTLFKHTAKTTPGSGPPKTDAQTMAVALAVYVTNAGLAGNAAVAYGFEVDAFGAGAATFNVGANGAAFGVANDSGVRVLDLLLAVNAQTTNGLLFDLNGDGDTLDTNERTFRTMANDVFSAINELGGV